MRRDDELPAPLDRYQRLCQSPSVNSVGVPVAGFKIAIT
jgi:hypothetical protein